MIPERKRIAMIAAGISMQSPQPYEKTPVQRFDAMWPKLQADAYEKADAILKATGAE